MVIPHGGIHRTEFHLPFQMLFAIICLALGTYVVGIKLGYFYNFLNLEETLLTLLAGFGCILGGFYMFLDKLYKPRVYL